MFPPLSCSRPTPLVFPLRGFGFALLTKNQRGRASDFPGDRHQQQQAGAATGEIDADNGGNGFLVPRALPGPGRPPAGPNLIPTPGGRRALTDAPARLEGGEAQPPWLPVPLRRTVSARAKRSAAFGHFFRQTRATGSIRPARRVRPLSADRESSAGGHRPEIIFPGVKRPDPDAPAGRASGFPGPWGAARGRRAVRARKSRGLIGSLERFLPLYRVLKKGSFPAIATGERLLKISVRFR